MRHEQVMYFDRCVTIYNFRKPTIAVGAGRCVAAGLMLAAMCDLIVAADDACFSNPVLRMTGAGVELLVEPWELGFRKAKEFLFTGDKIDAQEAWRLGLVNRVVPRAELESATASAGRQGRARAADHRADGEGLDQPGGRVHGQGPLVAAPLHGCTTSRTTRATALDALEERKHEDVDEGGLRRPRPRRRAQGSTATGDRTARPGCGSSTLGTRIAAPFCAGLLGEMGADVIKVEQPGTGDFMRSIGPFVAPTRAATRCSGRSRAAAGERHVRPAQARRARSCSAAGGDRRRLVENFRPGTMERWDLGPADLDPRLVYVRISVFGQDGPYSQRPGLDRMGIAYGGLLHLTGYPDRPPVRVGVTISDYLTGVVRGRGRARRAVRARRRRQRARSSTRALYGVGAAHPRVDAGRLRPARHRCASARATGWPTPRRSTTTRRADGRYVCIVAGSDANFATAVRGDGPPRAGRRPAVQDAGRPGRATATRSTTSWRRGPRRSTAAEVEAACLAARRARRHRVHRGRHLRRPAHGRARRPRHRRRPGGRPDAPAGAVPARRRRRPPTRPSGAPRLGEHNTEVWCDLVGLTGDELAQLQADRVV